MKKTIAYSLIVLTAILSFQSELFAQQHYVIDRSFGETCGMSVITGFPLSLQQIEMFKLSDGSYIQAGDVYDQGLFANLIVLTKFNNDGTVDSSFGTNGVVQHRFGNSNSVSCAAMSNDKIYVVGGESPSNAGSSVRAYIGRFNADGTPDSTFNSTGSVVELISTNPISGSIYSHIAIQPGGKVIAFGSEFFNINGGASIPVARRYNLNGSLDNTFHPAITYPGFNSMVASIGGHSAGVIDANGSIRFLYTINPNLAGQFIEQIVTVKIDSMGEPDATYGINGMNGMDIGGGELDNGIMGNADDDFVVNPDTGLTMGQLRYQHNYNLNTQRNQALLANNNNVQGGRRTKKRKSIKRKRSLKKRKSYKKNKKSRR